jgi:hypothetical protein
MARFNYDRDEDPYDDDEHFYGETIYNEDYYIEQEKELIRQSNLELELERLEDENIHEMREEGLHRPTFVRVSEKEPEDNVPAPESSSDDLPDLSF